VTRLFKRGELKAAVLDALDDVGPANGYTIMQAIAERIGEGWQPSPGAVYPALLGLEDAGLVRAREQDGAKLYELSESGERARATAPGTLDEVAARARNIPPPVRTLGGLLDAFAAGVAHRTRRLDPEAVEAVEEVLRDAQQEIAEIVTEGRP
jgi:DNA-binding PadR family transcriptional regulator